jgi:hypothetical protein
MTTKNATPEVAVTVAREAIYDDGTAEPERVRLSLEPRWMARAEVWLDAPAARAVAAELWRAADRLESPSALV